MTAPLPANGSARHDLVVVGTSAGGVEALQRLAADLPADFPAAVCVVQHVHAEGPGLLAPILDRAGPLPAAFPEDGDALQAGRIIVAPPDHHLLVKEGYVRVTRGPRENRCRPAIDPLLRSAAVAYGPRVVGVVLTGLLDDGASGLLAVQRCGGVTVVQDPDDAAYPDMPRSALQHVEADHVAPLRDLGGLLARLTQEPAVEAHDPPRDIRLEAEIAERAMSDIEKQNEIGHPVPLSCPDCGGPLWEIDADEVRRYRCHVGHAYTGRSLLADQDEAAEEALWVALRTMEERARMLDSLSADERARGRERSARSYAQKADLSRTHADRIRSLLLGGRQEAPTEAAATRPS